MSGQHATESTVGAADKMLERVAVECLFCGIVLLLSGTPLCCYEQCLCLFDLCFSQAGVNAAPEAIVTSLIRTDTAHQFNISIGAVHLVHATVCRHALICLEGARCMHSACFKPSCLLSLHCPGSTSLHHTLYTLPACPQMMWRWCLCARWLAAPSAPM
jgi:hypothetical protein